MTHTKDTPKETWETWKSNFLQHISDWSYFSADEELEKMHEQVLAQAKAEGVGSVIGMQPQRYNKSTLVTNQFIASCKNGERPIFESMDYVAISRKQWDEIKKQLATLREDYHV